MENKEWTMMTLSLRESLLVESAASFGAHFLNLARGSKELSSTQYADRSCLCQEWRDTNCVDSIADPRIQAVPSSVIVSISY